MAQEPDAQEAPKEQERFPLADRLSKKDVDTLATLRERLKDASGTQRD